MTHYICPKCKGALGHKSYASGSTPEWIECEICNGDGYITDTSELQKRIAEMENKYEAMSENYGSKCIECERLEKAFRAYINQSLLWVDDNKYNETNPDKIYADWVKAQEELCPTKTKNK